jgi:hypothetical protein
MAAIDSLLRSMLEKGGSDLHLTVGLPPKIPRLRLAPAHPRRPGRRPGDGVAPQGDLPAEKRWADFLDTQGSRPRPRDPRGRALPRQLPLQPLGPGRRLPADPREDPLLLPAQPPRGAEETLPPRPGPRRRHRPHRLRQVDHARGDDRLHQRQPRAPHHHHRGPHRVRAPLQEVHHRPPRGRRAHRVVRRRAQGRHAPRPRHPPPRRDARDGDHQARPRLRLDGHARLRHAAHQQRPEDRRPHHQHLSRRGAEPGARHARSCLAGVVAQLLCKEGAEGPLSPCTRFCSARGAPQHHPQRPDRQHQIDHRERRRRRHDHDGRQPHGPREGRHDRAEGGLHEGPPTRPLFAPLLKPGDLDGGH